MGGTLNCKVECCKNDDLVKFQKQGTIDNALAFPQKQTKNFNSIFTDLYNFDINLGEGTFGNSMRIINKKTNKFEKLKIIPKEILIPGKEKQIFSFYKSLQLLPHHINLCSLKSFYDNERVTYIYNLQYYDF